MISESFLAILACPETKQRLTLGDDQVLTKVRSALIEGKLMNIAGEKVEGPVTDVLIREDGKILYAVRDGIPVLLIDEGIRTESV